MGSVVRDKSLAFAKRIVKLYKYLVPKNDCCEIRKILASITKSTAESLNKTNIN